MILRSIELENFRNLRTFTLALDERGGVLQAPNGRGKTNFLEALHYLSLFRSFRGSADVELIRFGQLGFRVRGDATTGAGAPRSVGVVVEGSRKRISVDGREGRPAEHVGEALSVVLSPADIRLVQGSPQRRRRYLDVALAVSSRLYLTALQEYGRVLRQRNRVLQAGGGQRTEALLEPWTEQLAVHGATILMERGRFLARWGGRFSEICARLASSPEGAVRWRYESPLAQEVEEVVREREASERARAAGDESREPPVATAPSVVLAGAAASGGGAGLALTAAAERASAETTGVRAPQRLAAALRVRLERLAPAERRRGMTLAGPHRDDLSFHSAAPAARGSAAADVERDLRRFGSQGEQRTAALALRFVECEALTSERGELPVVLLDDVFSELDSRRSRELLDFLVPGQQVFLTTPKPLAIELPHDLPRYDVADGAVRAA